MYLTKSLLIFNIFSFATCYPGFGQFERGNSSTLILTHVLFRHGYRTSSLDELYPRDPYLNYNYFPFGRGQLTNKGKRREYSIGTALRERYNDFLGEYYYPGIVEATSSNFDRTKMSLELVLDGLFPPRDIERWSGSDWQPAPFNYTGDQLLLAQMCPNFIKMQNEVMSEPAFRNELEKYSNYFRYISENSGKTITTYYDLYLLYFGLTTEKEWGLQLPPWTLRVYPDFIRSMAIKYYYVMAHNTKMIQLFSGSLIKKMLLDTKSKILNRSNRKIYLYSAHEDNIANLLIALDIFVPHIPPYGSYIVFEVHGLDNLYGVKIYYQNYSSNNPQLLKLPTCDVFCPLDQFLTIVRKYLPTSDVTCE